MKYMQFLTPIYPENGYYSLTDEQIKQFEVKYNIRFPKALYEFYKLAGGSYTVIIDMELSSLEDMEYLLEDISDRHIAYPNQVPKPDEVFPFGEYGGNIYFVYRKDLHSEDPPVYIYSTKGIKHRNIPPNSVTLWANTFSEWIERRFNNLKQSKSYQFYVKE